MNGYRTYDLDLSVGYDRAVLENLFIMGGDDPSVQITDITYKVADRM